MEDCCKDKININWVKKLPRELCGNAIYFVRIPSGINMYVTNYQGVASLIGESDDTGNVIITSPDDSILITQDGQNFEISVSQQLQAMINMALQAGDNISLLNNDAGYITLSEVPSSVKTVQAGDNVSIDNTDPENPIISVEGLGSAAFSETADYATAQQGLKADTALQPGDNISELNNNSGYITLADVPTSSTNLTYTPSPTQGIVNSDTGTDAVIPLSTNTNAGLLSPTEKTKLAGIETGADLTDISIQNGSGIEQFKITDKILFKGVSFNNTIKQISIDAVEINTAFVDGVNGNDTTAEFGNANRPYKTIDAVYNGLTDDITRTIKVEIVRSGTYKINNRIPVGHNSISSLLPVIIDLSTNENQYIFTYNNGSLNGASFLFDIPNGTIQNLRANLTGVSLAQAQTTFTLNVKSINWVSSSFIFYGTDVIFIKIQNLSTTGPMTVATTSDDFFYCKQGFKIDTLTIPVDAVDVIFRGVGGTIDIGNLVMNSTKTQLTGSKYFRIGNINGTGTVTFNSQQGVTIVEYVNSTITIPIDFRQLISNLTFQGSIKSCTISTLSASRISTGILNFKNLIIENISSGWITFFREATFNILNTTIKVQSNLIRKTSDNINQLTVNITNSAIEQAVPTYLIECATGTSVGLKLSGLETNALSLGNSSSVIVDYALLSFKDKKNEIVIRSKVDLVNKTLDSNMNYIVDGVINLLPTDYIEVPVGGLSLSGYGFDVSSLKATSNNSTIFKSPVGGCGNLFLSNLSIEASGTGSKVFELTNAGAPTGGADAIELNVVNFDNCTSLGELTNFRQGLWNNIGIFGVKDGLTLSGVWSGGFRADLTIVRNFGIAATISTLFKAGTGLLFKSRFFTDLNADFKMSGSVSNFTSSNFDINKLYQLKGAQITRNGVVDPTQNYTGTINHLSAVSDWSGNNGVYNSVLQVADGVNLNEAATVGQIVNGTTISSASTLSINPPQQNSYFTFNGTTSTWTLGTLSSTSNKFITLINMGSGDITLNTNAGGNDIWDGGSNVNTMIISMGTSVRLYNNSLKYIIL